MKSITTRTPKRKELVYRLRARSLSLLEDDKGRRRQQNRWNGNGQGATNDSAEFKASVRIVDGYPVEYSCRDDPRQNNFHDINVTELSISFDYEMITVKNAEVVESTRSLEWSLLWNVARNMGLHNCNYRKQEPLFDGQRHLSSESYVVGLSSLDLDTVDRDTDFCTVLVTPQEGSVCTPMIGRMTAQFMGDEITVRNYLEHNIELEMNSRRVRIEQVKECRFVGDRNELTLSTVREGLHAKDKSVNLALVFGVLAGAFILGFALLMARGRRTRRQHVLDDDGTVANIPSVIFRKPDLRQTNDGIRQSSSSDTQESVSETHIIADAVAKDGTGIQEISVPRDAMPGAQNALSQAVDEHQTIRLENGDCETQDVSISKASEEKENIDVPPLPSLCVVPVDDCKPKEPAKSKTLQPRRKRRKKKKKKQRVLKRVSSRNSIDEMETIQEDDESADIDDESSEFEGSEYSTDDEDDTLGTLADNSGGADYVENSHRLPAETIIPPSPIREEPRIRRLPPPWI